MIYLRKANERGHANHGWLDSWHTFSFANYYDPNFMGFSALRVINDDVIEAGQGFGTHPHKDMEILTYVLEGTVEHQDSMGNKEQVPAGEFQIMSAGTGIRHSEYNPSSTERLHLYQIWIQVVKGNVTINGVKASTSDGLAIWDEQAISIHADSDSEVLLFDLPPV